MKKTIGVIGAGMVGVAAASFLQREGHDVFLVEPGNPGEGTSFGNAGCLNGSSVVPMSMPGTIRNVPRWLTDPMGPLVIRWSYLPTLAPWLIRFIAAGARRRCASRRRPCAPSSARRSRRWRRSSRTPAPRTSSGRPATSSSIARRRAFGRRASPGSSGATTASHGTSSTPTSCASSSRPSRATTSRACSSPRTGTRRTRTGWSTASPKASCATAAGSSMRVQPDSLSMTAASRASAPTAASFRRTARWSRPASGRSRSRRSSATTCRSRRSAATTS